MFRPVDQSAGSENEFLFHPFSVFLRCAGWNVEEGLEVRDTSGHLRPLVSIDATPSAQTCSAKRGFRTASGHIYTVSNVISLDGRR